MASYFHWGNLNSMRLWALLSSSCTVNRKGRGSVRVLKIPLTNKHKHTLNIPKYYHTYTLPESLHYCHMCKPNNFNIGINQQAAKTNVSTVIFFFLATPQHKLQVWNSSSRRQFPVNHFPSQKQLIKTSRQIVWMCNSISRARTNAIINPS